jgi:hypothetical protein
VGQNASCQTTAGVAAPPSKPDTICRFIEFEVYGSLHGWCVPDMPLQNGKPIYDVADADRACGKLVTLYEAALPDWNERQQH